MSSTLRLVKTSNCFVISSIGSGINIKAINSRSVHVLGDFDFGDIAWPDRLNKSTSVFSQSVGQMLIDIMNDHGSEQLVHFKTREKNTLDLVLVSLPGQFQETHFPDKLSEHDVLSGTLILQKRNLGGGCMYIRKILSMRKVASDFAKDRYFSGYSDNRSVQENFDLITSFIQESVDKHIPS